MSEPRDVLLVGTGRLEARLCQLLCARDDVRRVFLTPGLARFGDAKAQRVALKPDDADRLLAFVLRRGVGLIVEGPGGAGVGDRLRGLHSFLVHRPGSADPTAAAVWQLLPGGSSSSWRVTSPPPPAEPHTPYVPIRHECDRDHAYVFTLGPKEPSA